MAQTRLIAQPEEHTLSNGIPVILQHHEGSVAATYWWVRTGSVHEQKGEEGFAHFLEHMLFKDTAAKETGQASSGKMARAIESLGGDINAYTSFEQTVYHVTCAEHHWERVLNVFGTMAKPQKFLNLDFQREREVILEELRKNEDSPGRQMFQTLFSTTFSRHPYGRPVIGYEKSLKAAKVQQLEAFYRRRYVPEGMGLILVGPLDDAKGARKKAILRQLEKFFGSSVRKASRTPAKPMAIPQETPLRKGMVFKKRRFQVETPTLAFSFRMPELSHADIPALDTMANVIGSGELSRLYQRLFYKRALVTDTSAGLYVPNDPGMLYFELELPDMDKVEAAALEAFEAIAELKSQGPTREEFDRVVTNVESEKLYATQTADGVASRLGFLRFVIGDLSFDDRYVRDLKALTPERVRDAAREYLDARRMSGVLMYPRKAPEFSERAIVAAAERVFAPSRPAKAKAKAAAERAPGFEIIRRPSGIKIAHHYRPQSHAFSIHAAVSGGTRLELTQPIRSAEKDWGVSYMTSLTWTKGTVTRDARAISSIIEGRAAALDGYSGRNTIGLDLNGLARDWKPLSDLFTEVLVNPVFPEEEVGHSRRVAEDSIRGIQDHSSQLCSKLFAETLFERHPYGRLTVGSIESIAGIDTETLRRYHREWIRPERLTLSVTGNVSREELEAWIESVESGLAPRKGGMPGIERIADEPDLKAPRWVEKPLGREQSHIIVGGLGLTMDSPDRYAVRLMQNILGGQSGRLFIELREKKSLAYSVAPLSMEGIERGYIGTYIACGTPKVQEAILGIRKVLETLATKGPTTAEMSRAKEYYLGRRAMDLQSDSSLSSYYGLELLYRDRILTEQEIAKAINRVTARDVKEACRKYLVEPFMVTAIVG